MAGWRGRRRRATGVLLGLLSCGSLEAQVPPNGKAAGTKEKEETCRISGMVVKLADGTPLKNATVQLTNDADREHIIATKSGSDGRFALKNVPAGRYKLVVSRNGYVSAEYGQKKPADPGGVFALASGEIRQDLLFKLIPAAVIAGRVFDEDGEPAPRVSVVASREVYHQGRRTRASTAGSETDDLGQYRLFGLAPGRYYVSASQPTWGTTTGDREFAGGAENEAEKAYAKTYYPSTPDPGKAVLISVKEGEEIPGTDIALKQVVVHRIRGKVFNQMTRKGATEASLELVFRNPQLEWDSGGGQEVKKADGSFEFPNVVPGSYELVAFWFDQGKYYLAKEKVDVADSDLDGIVLTLGAGTVVPGRVRWEGKPSLERDELYISLEPAEVRYVIGPRSRVDATQQFTLRDVNEGDYRVSASGMSRDCYIKSVEYGDAAVENEMISVARSGGARLELTISSRGARIEGAVTDKDGLPATGVWAVAVPDEAKRNNSNSFAAQTTDQYGKYDLRGLAPGSYKIFGWTGVEQGEWEDPDFLKAQEAKGEPVEVRDEDRKTVNLKVIEKNGEGRP